MFEVYYVRVLDLVRILVENFAEIFSQTLNIRCLNVIFLHYFNHVLFYSYFLFPIFYFLDFPTFCLPDEEHHLALNNIYSIFG